MNSNILDSAPRLHANMSPESAKLVEIERELVAYSLVSKVCRYVNEYLEWQKLKPAQQWEYEDLKGYSPKNYLYGVLDEMYVRSMSGHGSEFKAVGILLAEEVILEQSFTRLAVSDRDGSALNKLMSIEERDDGFFVCLENLPFSPKRSEYSSEPPGYYKIEILLSKDALHNNTIMEMAKEVLAKLDKIESDLRKKSSDFDKY